MLRVSVIDRLLSLLAPSAAALAAAPAATAAAARSRDRSRAMQSIWTARVGEAKPNDEGKESAETRSLPLVEYLV